MSIRTIIGACLGVCLVPQGLRLRNDEGSRRAEMASSRARERPKQASPHEPEEQVKRDCFASLAMTRRLGRAFRETQHLARACVLGLARARPNLRSCAAERPCRAMSLVGTSPTLVRCIACPQLVEADLRVLTHSLPQRAHLPLVCLVWTRSALVRLCCGRVMRDQVRLRSSPL